MNNQHTKNQHTVPKCYLRLFSLNNNIWVYNKNLNQWKLKSIKDVSTEKYFYEHGNYQLNEIENKLSEIENEWSENGRDNLIENLKDDKYQLSNTDKEITAQFIATLMKRTKVAQRNQNNLFDITNKYLVDNNATNELLNEFNSVDNDEVFLNTLLSGEYKEPFLKKEWIVYKTNDSMHKFFISDSPIITDGSHLEQNYTINFILSPTLLLQLKDKHNKESNKIYNLSSSKIIYYNKLQLIDSLNEIYVTTQIQKKFVEKHRAITNEKKIVTLNEIPTTSENSSIIVLGMKRTKNIK